VLSNDQAKAQVFCFGAFRFLLWEVAAMVDLWAVTPIRSVPVGAMTLHSAIDQKFCRSRLSLRSCWAGGDFFDLFIFSLAFLWTENFGLKARNISVKGMVLRCVDSFDDMFWYAWSKSINAWRVPFYRFFITHGSSRTRTAEKHINKKNLPCKQDHFLEIIDTTFP